MTKQLASARVRTDRNALVRELEMLRAVYVLALIAFCVVAPPTASAQSAIQNPSDRASLSLNGEWQAIIDPYSTGDTTILGTPKDDGYFLDLKPDGEADLLEYDFDRAQTLTVPGDWRGQARELANYEGIVWYRKKFDASPKADRRYFIQFEAANYSSVVYLNGQLIGSHEGGFTPFSFEVTDKLVAGENSLVVKIDGERRSDRVPGIRMDWTNYTGVTRDVRLIETPVSFARNYQLSLADSEGKRISASVKVDGKPVPVRITIPALGIDWTGVPGADGLATTELMVDCLDLWRPDSPTLYDVSVTVGDEVVTDQIGFRHIAAVGDRLMLNGLPIFLRGISIHDEVIGVDGGRITTAAEAAALIDQAVELGANFIRLAHYPHNELILREADRRGLIVWSELPVYWGIDWSNPATLASAKQQYAEMIDRDFNRASILFWSVANETVNSSERLDFLSQLAADVRQRGGNRLIAAALLPDYSDEAVAKLVERVTGVVQGGVPEPYAVEIDDPLGEYIDVVSINQYYGWYYSRPIAQATGLPVADVREAVFKLIPNLRFSNAFGKPMIISELGAGALQGRRGEPDEIWTEDFQARFYRAQVGMMLGNPGLSGVSPWVLKDFRSPMRPLGGVQDGWNRKGLISETGERKLAFDVLKFFYRAYGTATRSALPPIPQCTASK
ncbi:glycoside hydrolase family 2 protein [Altererythrobacter lutimaris]|uniref:Beta galactosidase jelly roll domain-containing protein n=1 Tax=Altererythrobacter lutimaris TaxID=2743979 RepID=A0A850H581_9SPHN|nr:sugar-binding domain-containing protein [Altererythrobacter lutimaris]NVE94364.1 beta galactosidase jelly roll domain-containing protein [Altererythrobacter lutimaris]